MTNLQYKFLKFIYKKPRSIKAIYKKLGIGFEELQLICDEKTEKYFDSDCNSEFEDRLLIINNVGKAIVEERRRLGFSEWRAWGTLGIAVVALVVSIISLCNQQ